MAGGVHVFSVCVCVCIQTDGCHVNHANHVSHLNLHPTQLLYSTVLLCCFCPTNLLTTKIVFNLLLRNRELYFFFLLPPMGFHFCLPADEDTMKSVKNNSPTDSEMQTAIASKDKGFF